MDIKELQKLQTEAQNLDVELELKFRKLEGNLSRAENVVYHGSEVQASGVGPEVNILSGDRKSRKKGSSISSAQTVKVTRKLDTDKYKKIGGNPQCLIHSF